MYRDIGESVSNTRNFGRSYYHISIFRLSFNKNPSIFTFPLAAFTVILPSEYRLFSSVITDQILQTGVLVPGKSVVKLHLESDLDLNQCNQNMQSNKVRRLFLRNGFMYESMYWN